MRTPPDGLDEAELAAELQPAWHLTVTDLRHEPVGFGSHHWVATDADGSRRFVTVDDLGTTGATAAARLNALTKAFRTAYALRHEAGLSTVVAPLLSHDGSVLRPLGTRYVVAVYPFVDGRPFPEGERATSQDRAAVVDMLARLHDATTVAGTYAGVDDLGLPARGDLERALDRLHEPWTTGPFDEPARELLASAATEVRWLLEECDRIAAATRDRSTPWVVTHGEPKPDNLLATEAGPMMVDWDTTLVAPAARDLWMVDGMDDDLLAHYADRTGRVVRREELRFYRLRWDLAEIAEYVRWFTAPHTRTADSEIAWGGLSGTIASKDGWTDRGEGQSP